MKNKKLIIILSFLLIIIFIPFTISADPSFTVIRPKDGQLFTIGNNVISWDPPIPENISHVKIELHKGFARIKAIDTWVDNTGRFVWVIDKNDKYETGSDYRIKILSSIDNDIYGWSEYFCIDLNPIDPWEITISISSIIIISILLVTLTVMYYRKNISNWIKKIRSKLNDKNK